MLIELFRLLKKIVWAVGLLNSAEFDGIDCGCLSRRRCSGVAVTMGWLIVLNEVHADALPMIIVSRHGCRCALSYKEMCKYRG